MGTKLLGCNSKLENYDDDHNKDGLATKKNKSKSRYSHFVSVISCKSTSMMPSLSHSASPSVDCLPFSGLVICVTGLSKEARNQVQAATERMGGQYSPDLHPQCTHLIVQSFSGPKFEHALKHGLKRGLFVVTLAWFVSSVKCNARLDESCFGVSNTVEHGLPLQTIPNFSSVINLESSCLPSISHDNNKSLSLSIQRDSYASGKDFSPRVMSVLSGHCFYIDTDMPSDLQNKVAEAARREGATCIDHWFIGCNATHVVCEGPSVQKYVGYATNLVTPLWVLKTARERFLQRLVHFSTDLARQVAIMLDNSNGKKMDMHGQGSQNFLLSSACSGEVAEKEIEERKEKINTAKACIRRRRGPRMQPCRTIPRPLTPASLLDSICWSISDSTSTASVYVDNAVNGLTDRELNMKESESRLSLSYIEEEEKHSDALSFSDNETVSRTMKESERQDVIYRGVFLTVLFPVDRFGEMGPSARTFFSESGFTCLQILDYIYSFYQETMSLDEVEVAIHTDSKHADRLRSMYASKEVVELGRLPVKRIEFLGSRRSFEGLKRISRENTGQLYELCLGA